MGNVVPFRRVWQGQKLGVYTPQLPSLPSIVLVSRLAEAGVVFKDEVGKLFIHDRSICVNPVKIAVASRRELVCREDALPHQSFLQAGSRLHLGEVTLRSILELLLQPYYLPCGDYYLGLRSPVRIHVSKRTSEHMVIRGEPVEQFVTKDYDWLWHA